MIPAPDNGQGHDRYRDDLAAYALGALDGREADALRGHLEECTACRQQLRWLQPAVELLPRSVEQLEPPRRLRARLMKTVRSESRAAARGDRAPRRRRRGLLWRPATALAAVALVAVGAIGGYLAGGPSDDSSIVAAEPVGPAAGSGAAGTLERTEETAILHVRGMPPLPRDRVYQAWVQRGSVMEPSSVFVLGRNNAGEAVVASSLEGADAVVVTREPRGGSRRPSSPPMLQAELRQ